MDELFSADPVQRAARRGERALPMRRAPKGDPWPPRDRDPGDLAVVATRLLAVSGRMQSRLHATARKHHVDPYLLRFLLLFAESNRPLRIGNVAELLAVSPATASRTAKRAQAAGLVDKFATAIDGREVTVRITATGRTAVTRCLDAIRHDATAVLGVRAAEIIELLGPPPYLRRASENAGWRAGVRAGMPAGE
jgi:DNA-binding MarR family transcriptional regulator